MAKDLLETVHVQINERSELVVNRLNVTFERLTINSLLKTQSNGEKVCRSADQYRERNQK
jgi:hypothetical protein